MADNPDKDEYQFPDVNDVGSDFAPIDQTSSEGESKPQRPVLHEQPDIKRVVIAVMAVILIAVFAYKLGHWLFFSKNEVSASTLVQAPILPPAPPAQIVPVVQEPPVSTTVSEPSSDMQQKISQLEYTQDGMRTEVTAVSQKMSSIDANFESLKTDMQQMQQILNEMKQKMADDTEHMKHLLSERKTTKAKMHTPMPTMQYFIQALIPGRAWLVGENGTTVTVNVGSRLPGYGTIRVIDPNLGRVGTSSGKMIVYSQRDS